MNFTKSIINRSFSSTRFIKMMFEAFVARRAVLAAKGRGMEFDSFGRYLGWRLMLKGQYLGIEYLLHPIVHVRYWEYSFVYSSLPDNISECLDVSSPRLFSLYIAMHRHGNITMINPDASDIQETAFICQRLNIPNVSIYQSDVERLNTPEMTEKFDAIWSISVVEHIDGQYKDSNAVRFMYNALKKGGRLIITVPVDRKYRAESSKIQLYGTQPKQADGTYFFQRIYDVNAIKTRLSDSIGKDPTVIRWFGEHQSGWYDQYVNSIRSSKVKWAVQDVQEINDNFREFDSWDTMPGMGICGLMYKK